MVTSYHSEVHASHDHSEMYELHDHSEMYGSHDPSEMYGSHDYSEMYGSHDPSEMYESHDYSEMYGSLKMARYTHWYKALMITCPVLCHMLGLLYHGVLRGTNTIGGLDTPAFHQCLTTTV